MFFPNLLFFSIKKQYIYEDHNPNFSSNISCISWFLWSPISTRTKIIQTCRAPTISIYCYSLQQKYHHFWTPPYDHNERLHYSPRWIQFSPQLHFLWFSISHYLRRFAKIPNYYLAQWWSRSFFIIVIICINKKN